MNFFKISFVNFWNHQGICLIKNWLQKLKWPIITLSEVIFSLFKQVYQTQKQAIVQQFL